MPATTTANSSPKPEPTPPTTPNNTSPLLSPRSLRQFSLYAFSSILLTLSLLSTRRALLLRRPPPPPYFQPSFPLLLNHPLNLRREAADALRLATFNVLGFFAVLGSGGLWAADISGWTELKGRAEGIKEWRRRRKRGNLEGDREGEKKEGDGEVEREVERLVGRSLRGDGR